MLTLFFSFLMAARADIPQRPQPGGFELKSEFDYMSTHANYPPNGGTTQSLETRGKFVNMSGVGQFASDWDEHWRTYLGISGGQTSADVIDGQNTTPTNLAIDTKRVSGLNEGWAGIQWWNYLPRAQIVPQLDFSYPFFRATYDRDDPLLGEGAMRLQLGSWLLWHVADITPFAYLGGAYRDDRRSALIVYNIGLRYGRRGKFWLSGEYRGYNSVINDRDTDNRIPRDIYLSAVDGGSYAYGAVNPSVGEVAATAGMYWGPVAFYLGAATTVYGRSAASSITAIAGILFSGSFFESAAPVHEEKFEPKAEKYDETLFRQRLTPAPPQEPQDDEPRIETLHKEGRKYRPRRAEPKLDLMMKDTEKSMERRGK